MTLEAFTLEPRSAHLVAASARFLLRDSLGRLSPTGHVGIHLWVHRGRRESATLLVADTTGLSIGSMPSPNLQRAISCIRWAGYRMVREQTALGITVWLEISSAYESRLADKPKLVLV